MKTGTEKFPFFCGCFPVFHGKKNIIIFSKSKNKNENRKPTNTQRVGGGELGGKPTPTDLNLKIKIAFGCALVIVHRNATAKTYPDSTSEAVSGIVK